MYKVIGHDELRAELAKWNHPFAIVGPEGVGRTGIQYEKFSSMSGILLDFAVQQESLVSTYYVRGVRNFFVGRLTDQNVSDILKRDYPKIMNRAVAVGILDGSMSRLNELSHLIEAFDKVTDLLSTHTVPSAVTRYLMEATAQACLSRIGSGHWAYNQSLITSSIPVFLANWYLKASPTEASTIQFYYGVRDGFVD